MTDTLFDWDAKKHRRNSDHITSHLAALDAGSMARQHQAIIYRTLAAHPEGLTSEEAANHCALRFDQVWRRMSDLERGGYIVKTDLTRRNSSNRQAVVWRVVKI